MESFLNIIRQEAKKLGAELVRTQTDGVYLVCQLGKKDKSYTSIYLTGDENKEALEMLVKEAILASIDTPFAGTIH